jgi:hypothetical protein
MNTELFWVVTQRVAVISFRFLTPEDGAHKLPETSVRNYHYSLRKNPGRCSSQIRKIILIYSE